jgi:hypothetical protein
MLKDAQFLELEVLSVTAHLLEQNFRIGWL